jgi:hypothetical protein
MSKLLFTVLIVFTCLATKAQQPVLLAKADFSKENINNEEEDKDAAKAKFKAFIQNNKVYSKPDVLAQYADGEEGLVKFLNEKLSAIHQNNGELKIVAKMMITKEGKVEKLYFISTGDVEPFNSESETIIAAMNTWKPAKMKDIDVDSIVTTPMILKSKE